MVARSYGFKSWSELVEKARGSLTVEKEPHMPLHPFEILGRVIQTVLCEGLHGTEVGPPSLLGTIFKKFHDSIPQTCFILTFIASLQWEADALWNDGGPVSLELDLGLVKSLLGRGMDDQSLVSVEEFISIAPVANAIVQAFGDSWSSAPPIVVSDTELELSPDNVTLGIRSHSEPVYVVEYQVLHEQNKFYVRVCQPAFTHEVVTGSREI